MDFIKKSLTVNTPVQKGCAELGVDGDIIVPDVLPDILKVIQVDGNSYLSSCEITEGRLSCTGKLELKILYIPDAQEEKIKSVVTSLDFSHVMSNGNLTEGVISDVSADVSKVDFQLINSRKLKIRSVVSLGYCFSNAETIEIPSEAEDENSFELKKKSIHACSFVTFKDTQFLVRESLELPSGQASIHELLKLDVSVCDTEFKVISGRVVVKGICGVCALYTDSGCNVRYADFEIPFTEIIDLEDANEETICEADFSICDVSYHTEADSDGDCRIIFTEILVGAKINAYEDTELDYIEDCYCPGHNMTSEKEMKTVESIIAKGMSTVTLREIIGAQKSAPALSGIYNIIAKPVIESAKADNGKVCVEGKVQCYCLYICAGDEAPVYSIQKEISFCENIDAEGCAAGCDCRVRAEIVHKNGALNSAGETELKLNLSLDVLVTKQVSVPVFTSLEVSEIEAEDRKGIVIYFVRSGDNLWDVAKRYKVFASDIAELNGLESEELSDGMRLLIPSE